MPNQTQTPQSRLAYLVQRCEDNDLVNAHKKAFPYLGWYWRDIDRSSTSISWHNGKLWLNEPRKWDYPSTSVSNERPDKEGYIPPEEYLPGDLDAMCTDLCEVLETVLENGRLRRQDSNEIQSILFEYAGYIPVTWYRCTVNDCDEGFKDLSDPLNERQAVSLYEHITDAHPDELGEDSTPTCGDHWERFTYEYIDTDPTSETHGHRLDPSDVESPK